MSTPTPTAPVVRLDLTQAPSRLADPAELRRVVGEALGEAATAATERFLVLDTAEGLVHNQRIYEQVLAYGSGHALCVVTGAPPAGPDDGDAPDGPAPWILDKPSSLRPPTVGVLWVPDPYGGAGPAPDRSGAALRPLLDLLAAPALFDAVLAAVAVLPKGVAIPALRVLEHDLSDAARARAWQQALTALVGEETPGAAVPVVGADTDGVPAVLEPLVGGPLPKSVENAPWCRPDGEVDRNARACDTALREAEEEYERVRGAAGLLGGPGRTVRLRDALDEVARCLADHRDTVRHALVEGDAVGLPPEQRGKLYERGIDVPPIPDLSRADIVPGLRLFAGVLFRRRLPLRSVADRLGALSDRATPTGSSARLGQLDQECPPDLIGRLAEPRPFLVRRVRRRELAALGAAAAAVALWPGIGRLLGLLVAAAAAALALLAAARNPEGRRGSESRPGAWPRLAAGVLGTAAGATAGTALGVPIAVGVAALPLAAAVPVLFAVRRWTEAVDDWWEATGAPAARGAQLGLERLLEEAAVHDWLLADVRLYCANGARAAAGMLRSVTDAVEEHRAEHAAGGPGRPAAPGIPRQAAEENRPERRRGGRDDRDEWGDWDDWNPRDSQDEWDDWGDWDDPPAPGADPPAPGSPGTSAPSGEEPEDAPPRWLEREVMDGGPELVATLAGDLFDGVARLLAPWWGAFERDPDKAAALPLHREVRHLLDGEIARLAEEGVTAPPPFARDLGARPDPAMLLGIAPERVAGTLAAEETGPGLVALCAREHRRLLSRERRAGRRVRFAPESVRRAAHPAVASPELREPWDDGEDIVWTPVGRYAGVLRLLPLRLGSVRTVRPRDGADPPTAPGTGGERTERGERRGGADAVAHHRGDD
ncbi:hypothetical protein [Streptomyces macrosporus]|uniref:Uncharacterized protein n=1 Tax=Streptomyces macrosporus TaxID=44032 RepID=A0ABN3K7W0_9ACTN